MPLDWGKALEPLSRVQKLVHLAMRYDSYDVDRIRTELLQTRRRAFEDELTIQAARAGCPGRSGMLTNGPILSELNEQCATDAASIANTYNYDLVGAIVTIRSETPTANRWVYAKRLREWEAKRAEWKVPQIALFTEMWARSRAQQAFYQYNGHLGVAFLEPKTAVCPVCLGLIARGEVPLSEAMSDPGPWHPNCPHYWRTIPDRVHPDQCAILWMGE